MFIRANNASNRRKVKIPIKKNCFTLKLMQQQQTKKKIQFD